MKEEVIKNQKNYTEEEYWKIANKFYNDRKNKTLRLYNTYNEYIEQLENLLEYELDLSKKNIIKKEIKKLKKEQKRFNIPSELTHDMCTNSENRNYDPAIFDKNINSSDMLVKRKTYKSN